VITVGSPPSITATTLFVVPRSIPIIFAIEYSSLPAYFRYRILPESKKSVNNALEKYQHFPLLFNNLKTQKGERARR
jgi:hypothetical protein